eukprot:Rhum_TRINITY_DN1159_c0_g1::Rhum_TRINITY_DN1159_c0_g1_i1::g.3529::m.3529
MSAIEALASFNGQGATSLLGFSPLKSQVVDKDNEVTDDVPAPHVSNCGHISLILLYFLCVGGYMGYSIYKYVDRPDVETYSQQPSEAFAPPKIKLSLQCFDSPNCGVITVTRNYSGAVNCPVAKDVQSVETFRLLTNPMELDLCYVEEGDVVSSNTGELLATPGLSIDFSKINTGEKNTTKAHAAVVVEVGRMKKVVGIDSWQIKSFYVGMSVTKDGSDVKTQRFFAQNLQYDGKRPTWRATYIIRLAQLANVYEVSRPGHWLDVVAEVGGAATIIAALLVLSEPLWSALFPGSEKRLPRGRMYWTRGSHRVASDAAKPEEHLLAKSDNASNASNPAGTNNPKSTTKEDFFNEDLVNKQFDPAHSTEMQPYIPLTTSTQPAQSTVFAQQHPPSAPQPSAQNQSSVSYPTPTATRLGNIAKPPSSFGGSQGGSASGRDLHVGDQVVARYGDSRLAATVMKVSGDTVDLRWAEGTFSLGVAKSSVSKPGDASGVAPPHSRRSSTGGGSATPPVLFRSGAGRGTEATPTHPATTPAGPSSTAF